MLEKAITTIKHAEQVRGQHDVLRNSKGKGHIGTTDLPAIRNKSHDKRSTRAVRNPLPS